MKAKQKRTFLPRRKIAKAKRRAMMKATRGDVATVTHAINAEQAQRNAVQAVVSRASRPTQRPRSPRRAPSAAQLEARARFAAMARARSAAAAQAAPMDGGVPEQWPRSQSRKPGVNVGGTELAIAHRAKYGTIKAPWTATKSALLEKGLLTEFIAAQERMGNPDGPHESRPVSKFEVSYLSPSQKARLHRDYYGRIQAPMTGTREALEVAGDLDAFLSAQNRITSPVKRAGAQPDAQFWANQ